jgi:hypothetical protein
LETLEFAKYLGGLPVSVLLIAALIVVWVRSEKRDAACKADYLILVEKHDEMIEQYQSLLREALATLTRVGDMLK